MDNETLKEIIHTCKNKTCDMYGFCSNFGDYCTYDLWTKKLDEIAKGKQK